MAWVNDYGQMCLAMQIRNCRQRQRKSGVRFEGPNSSLAEHHVWIPFVENVLGGEQPLFDRCARPSLEQHGATRSTDCF